MTLDNYTLGLDELGDPKEIPTSLMETSSTWFYTQSLPRDILYDRENSSKQRPEIDRKGRNSIQRVMDS